MESQPRVLIVEPDEVLRTLLITMLKYQQVEVDTASTADEAFDRVTTCDYALILIDFDMPGGQAELFLERFHDFRPEATTFVIAMHEAHPDPRPLYVHALLRKPLEIDAVAEAIRECALVVPRPADPLDCPPPEIAVATSSAFIQ